MNAFGGDSSAKMPNVHFILPRVSAGIRGVVVALIPCLCEIFLGCTDRPIQRDESIQEGLARIHGVAGDTARPVSSTAPLPASVPQACGQDGSPDCPMQAWMKSHVTQSLNKNDFAALENELRTLSTFAPKSASYKNWASIATDGSNAARAEDAAAVRGACRECHRQYSKRYRDDGLAPP